MVLSCRCLRDAICLFYFITKEGSKFGLRKEIKVWKRVEVVMVRGAFGIQHECDFFLRLIVRFCLERWFYIGWSSI